jgi:hypothetical protein
MEFFTLGHQGMTSNTRSTPRAVAASAPKPRRPAATAPIYMADEFEKF